MNPLKVSVVLAFNDAGKVVPLYIGDDADEAKRIYRSEPAADIIQVGIFTKISPGKRRKFKDLPELQAPTEAPQVKAKPAKKKNPSK